MKTLLKLCLISNIFLTGSIFAQFDYNPNILDVSSIELLYKDRNVFKLSEGVLDFIGFDILGNYENLFSMSVFLVGDYELCGYSTFLSSKNIKEYYEGYLHYYEGYLNVLSSNPYKIKVAFRNEQDAHSVVSYLYDDFLFIKDIPDDPIDDLIIVGVQSSEGLFQEASVVVLEFQNDGSFEILEEEEARLLAKKYNFY